MACRNWHMGFWLNYIADCGVIIVHLFQGIIELHFYTPFNSTLLGRLNQTPGFTFYFGKHFPLTRLNLSVLCIRLMKPFFEEGMTIWSRTPKFADFLLSPESFVDISSFCLSPSSSNLIISWWWRQRRSPKLWASTSLWRGWSLEKSYYFNLPWMHRVLRSKIFRLNIVSLFCEFIGIQCVEWKKYFPTVLSS